MEKMEDWSQYYDGHETEFQGKTMKGHTLFWYPKLPEQAHLCWLNLCRVSKDAGWFTPRIELIWTN